MTRPSRTYFEDVRVGDEISTPAMTVTETHTRLYAGVSGDEALAPGRIPEILPICLSTGLGWRLPRAPLAVLAFMGLEWQIAAPLAVGDTIHSRSRTAAKRSMRDGGVIIEEHEIVDQRGVVVQRGRFTFLVAKRPPDTPSSPPETQP